MSDLFLVTFLLLWQNTMTQETYRKGLFWNNGFGALESMTIIAESMRAGRQAQCWRCVFLHPDTQP